mmetsp:Transcript_23424/g.43114  ORF Transcript_23424/g.43114 Transcript_23424/m.43114 type:complete len:1209 (-) Transcript_23424:62-3688(-)
MRAKKAEEAFLERYRGRNDRTPPPPKQALPDQSTSRRLIAASSRSTPHGHVRSPRSSDNHERGVLASGACQALKAGLESRSTSVHSRAPCSRLDSLAHLRLAWERISTEELLELSAEVNEVVDSTLECFLTRPSFELEVKVVALICAMGLADETVSVAGVLDDELPLSAWISAQRMLQMPGDVLDALEAFPPHSARCSQDAPWPGQALQAARVFLAQDADEVSHCVLSHLQLWIQAAVLHFDPSMTTYVDDPSALDDPVEDSVELVHRPSLLSIDDGRNACFGAATPTQAECHASDEEGGTEEAEVAALFREAGNEVQQREEIFRSKLPVLEDMGCASNTSLFGETSKLGLQDDVEEIRGEVREGAASAATAPAATAVPAEALPAHMESLEELLRKRMSEVLAKRAGQEVASGIGSSESRACSKGESDASEAAPPVQLAADVSRAPRVLVHDVETPSLQHDPHAPRVLVHDEGSPFRAEQQESPSTSSSHSSSDSDGQRAAQDEYTNSVTFSGDITQLQRWQRSEQNNDIGSNNDIACDPESTSATRVVNDDNTITRTWQLNALKEVNGVRDNTADAKACKENLPPKKEDVARKLSLGATAGMDAGRPRRPQEAQQSSTRCTSTPVAGTTVHPNIGSQEHRAELLKGEARGVPASGKKDNDVGCSPTMQLQFGNDDSADLDMLCKALERAAASSQPTTLGAGSANPPPRIVLQQDHSWQSADTRPAARPAWKAPVPSAASTTPPSRSWPYVSPAASQAHLRVPSPWPAPTPSGNDPSTASASGATRGAIERLHKSAPFQQTPCMAAQARPASAAARSPPSPSAAALSEAEGLLARLRARQSATQLTPSTQRTPPPVKYEAPYARTPRTWTPSPAPAEHDVKGILTRLHAASAAPLPPLTPRTSLHAPSVAALPPTQRTTPRVHRLSEPPSAGEHRGILSDGASSRAQEHRWNRVSMGASPLVPARLHEDSFQMRRTSDLSFQRLHDAAEKVKRPPAEQQHMDDARGGLELLLQNVNQLQQRRQSTPCGVNLAARGPGASVELLRHRQPAVSGSPWRRSVQRAPQVMPEVFSDAISDPTLPPPAKAQMLQEEPRCAHHVADVQVLQEVPRAQPESPPSCSAPSLSKVELCCAETKHAVAAAGRNLHALAEQHGSRIGMCIALVLLFIICMWCTLWLAKVIIGGIAWKVGEPPLEHLHLLHNPDGLQGYF